MRSFPAILHPARKSSKHIKAIFSSLCFKRNYHCDHVNNVDTTENTLLYSWGTCWTNGLLGSGKLADKHYTPQPLPLKNVMWIESGANHILAFVNNTSKKQQLLSWGENKFGQLGRIDGSSSEPKPIDFFEGKEIYAASCGGDHSIVCVKSVENEFKSYSFGLNEHGQLGLNDKQNRDLPYEILGLKNKRVKALSCSQNFSIVATEDGNIYFFGRKDELDITLPHVLLKGINEDITISSGWGHSIISLKNSKKVLSFGSNLHGQLGQGTKSKWQDISEVKSLEGENIQSLACGSTLSLAVVDDNIWIWGSVGDGKLGLGETQKEDLLVPHRIPFFDKNQSTRVIRVASGTDHVIVQTKLGLFGWGFGQHGALGLGDNQLKTFYTPQQIPFQNPENIINIKALMDVSFALVKENKES